MLTRLSKHYWVGVGEWYGSGLRFELEGEPDLENLEAPYGPRVISRINFDRGRLRPSHSLDLSVGATFRTCESSSIRLQSDILNATNHLDLLYFAGLFSGTGIAAPPSYHIRLSLNF